MHECSRSDANDDVEAKSTEGRKSQGQREQKNVRE